MVDLYTTAKVSPAGKLNKEDISRWLHNLLVFLAPLALVYVLQLSASLQNGNLTLQSLIPSATTIGGIQLYLVNGVLDLIRKFMDSSK